MDIITMNKIKIKFSSFLLTPLVLYFGIYVLSETSEINAQPSTALSCVIGGRIKASGPAVGYGCIEAVTGKKNEDVCATMQSAYTDPSLRLFVVSNSSCSQLGFTGTIKNIPQGTIRHCMVGKQQTLIECSVTTIAKLKSLIGF